MLENPPSTFLPATPRQIEPGDIISFGTTGKGNADFPRGHKSVLLGEVSGEITIEVPKLGTLRNTIFHKTGGL